MSEEFDASDKSLFFVHNFTDVRAKITVKVEGKSFANNTIPALPADYVTGQNLVLNNTNPNITMEQTFSFIINGKNKPKLKE